MFLQAVSHDLRGPIAAILGLASTLERPELSLSDDDARDLASRIVSNARKLDRIVSDLLDLDRLERGVLTATFVPTDIGAVVRELVAGADVVAGRRLDLDTAPLTMPADVVMVERIVDNLLRNAVRHTPGDSRIWVRVERMDDGALITVEDDGPGVAPEDRARIFEAFHQGARPGLDRGRGCRARRRRSFRGPARRARMGRGALRRRRVVPRLLVRCGRPQEDARRSVAVRWRVIGVASVAMSISYRIASPSIS